ncbi:phage portal protein [Kitasatospora sp. NPDC003701]
MATPLLTPDQLTSDEQRLLDRLWQRLQQARSAPASQGGLDVLQRYYDADRYMRSIGLNVPPGWESLQTVIAWPAQAVDTVEERLDVEGFRASAADAPSEDLWDLWQTWGMDEESQIAHLDALTLARSYGVVGVDAYGDPVITVEGPQWMIHERSAATRQVTAAARFVQAAEEVDLPQYQAFGRATAATLWPRPGMTVQLVRREDGGWWVVDRSVSDMPWIPVVPFINRARSSYRAGRSEMLRVIPVADACCRALTNMQVATEFQAVPQRYVLGASADDFVDKDGKPVPAWEAYLGRVWALANESAHAGQFAAADLRNFETAILTYGKLAASLQGVPLAYFAAGADNPTSADAIKAEEARLVKNCERRQRSFSGPWENLMRMALWISHRGKLPSGLERMATVWRDPSTPTMSAKADYVQKMVATKVFPPSYGPEALGLPVSEQERIAELWAEEDPSARLASALDRATQPAPAPVPTSGPA